MKMKNIFLFSALAGMSMIARVEAATLYTSPLWAQYTAEHSYHACNIVNLAPVAMPVKVRLLTYNGAVLKEDTTTLNPNASWETLNANGNVGFAYCQFDVKSTAKVRANITVFRYSGTYYQVLGMDSAR